MSDAHMDFCAATSDHAWKLRRDAHRGVLEDILMTMDSLKHPETPWIDHGFDCAVADVEKAVENVS